MVSPTKSWRHGECHCGEVGFAVNLPDSVEECGGSLGDGDDEAGLLAVYGSWLWLWLLLASWLLQLALLWVALGLLYFSHPKVSQ